MEHLDNKSKNMYFDEAKGLAEFFKVSVKIQIFGRTIFEWTWPPQKP